MRIRKFARFLELIFVLGWVSFLCVACNMEKMEPETEVLSTSTSQGQRVVGVWIPHHHYGKILANTSSISAVLDDAQNMGLNTVSSLLEIRQNTNKRAGSKRCLEREPEFAVQIL